VPRYGGRAALRTAGASDPGHSKPPLRILSW
jgi:hypothetical protein